MQSTNKWDEAAQPVGILFPSRLNNMNKILKSILNWYFSKRALPYWTVLIIDIITCYLSGIFVFWLYYHGAVTLGNILILTKTIFVYMIFNLIGFRVFHTYAGIIRYSSFVDLQRVGMAQGLSCVLALIFHYIVYPWHMEIGFIPLEGRQIIAMYVIATILMWGMRVLVKTLYDVAFSSDNGLRTLIYGVGDHGIGLAKNIRNIKPTQFQLKGFISHDKNYEGRVLMGEKVYRPDKQLADVIKGLHIQAVLVSQVQANKFRDDEKLQDMLISEGVKIYFAALPENWNKESKDIQNVHLHEVKIEDLLPRDEIKVDLKSIAELLKGHRILITGSAGSIGSEMVRQVAEFKPAELILIDQAETPQHDIRLMMRKHFPSIDCQTIVASITQEKLMDKIFKTNRPDYVFHAAAYKHVPMMEDSPSEAIYNNVYGTKIMADLSVKYGVRKFVMISTDKAVNPTNVMGCSKRICEIYVQSLDKAIKEGKIYADACQDDAGMPMKAVTQFVTTRFGNVLGSNGSVIPLFKEQIKNGGPVTVTHPDIIRFFMLIPEACKLVLEAGTMGNGGEIFVFDMGQPVKIVDLAKRMIKLSGAKDVEIKFTGLRDGEKLYEEVLNDKEVTLPTFHKKIKIAKVREYDYADVCKELDELSCIAQTFDDMKIVGKMKQIVPEYKSQHSKYQALDK